MNAEVLARLDERLGPWIENGLAISGITVTMVYVATLLCELIAEAMQ